MGQNSIYFTFTLPPTRGGHFVALEHIAALIAMGFNAKAYYLGPPDGFGQFSVPVVQAGSPMLPDDVVVVGEHHKNLLQELKPLPCIKVLHHQAFFYTFNGFDSIAELNAYPFRHILVASDYCAGRLKDLGVRHAISRVRPALPGYFMPGEKRLQIAFAPGKRFIEAQFLKGYFQAKAPEFAHVPWIPLIEMSRQDCAGIMGQSAVFATLPLLESLGLTALEAMAADCHVVGYTGHGGAEYATPQNGDWIAEGDHDGFVAKLRQACALFGSDNPKLAAGRATAAQFSRAGFERELAEAWNAILGDRAPRYRN